MLSKAQLVLALSDSIQQYHVNNQCISESQRNISIDPNYENNIMSDILNSQTFSESSKDVRSFKYKNASIDATDIDYKANIWETKIINYFKENPKELQYSDIKSDAQGQFLILANPLIDKNNIIGAKIVSVYDHIYQNSTQGRLNELFMSLVFIFVIMVVVLNIFLHFIILKPILLMAIQSKAISQGQSSIDEIHIKGKNELTVIAQSFNRMQRSLKAAMLMLSK